MLKLYWLFILWKKKIWLFFSFLLIDYTVELDRCIFCTEIGETEEEKRNSQTIFKDNGNKTKKKQNRQWDTEN